jgi:hypothetical protein
MEDGRGRRHHETPRLSYLRVSPTNRRGPHRHEGGNRMANLGFLIEMTAVAVGLA